MKKILIQIFILFSFLLFSPFVNVTFAQPFDCGFWVECIDPLQCKDINSNAIKQGTRQVKFHFDLGKIPTDFWNTQSDSDGNGNPDIFDRDLTTHPDSSTWCNDTHHGSNTTSSKIEEIITSPGGCHEITSIGDHAFHLRAQDNNKNWFDLCLGNYSVVKPALKSDITVTSKNGKQDIDSEWDVNITFSPDTNIEAFLTNLDSNINLNADIAAISSPSYVADKGNLSGFWDDSDTHFTLKPLPPGTHIISLIDAIGLPKETFKTVTFTVLKRGEPTPSKVPLPTLSADCLLCTQLGSNQCGPSQCRACPFCPTPAYSLPDIVQICDQLTTENDLKGKCWNCMNQGKVWTAIGCISTEPTVFIKDYIFTIGVAFAGAIAFLFFLYGTFLILTSAGNPERIEQGKQIIVSALSGLLLIIFSIFFLRIIGVDILQLPGFS